MTYSVSFVIAPLLGTVVYQRDHHLFWYFSLGVGLFAMISLAWLSRRLESKAVS